MVSSLIVNVVGSIAFLYNFSFCIFDSKAFLFFFVQTKKQSCRRVVLQAFEISSFTKNHVCASPRQTRLRRVKRGFAPLSCFLRQLAGRSFAKFFMHYALIGGN
jgi:hypothetical protein